ncbi:MAG: glycosyltransferase [Flavobacteriales bacterium]|nr:glycosyltransferase [Flavobacteriales bacterium]
MSIRIVLANPTPHDRQESFVTAHATRLDRVVRVITHGTLPGRNAQGVPLLEETKGRRFFMRLRSLAGGYDRKGLLQQRIAALLREERAAVVLAEYGTCANALIDACSSANVPLVAHFHGFDAHTTSALRETGNYRRLFQHAAGCIAVSEDMKRHLLALGAPSDRLLLNSCGVDIDRFVPGDAGEAPPLFVSVGRFVEKKAPMVLIAAFRRVLAARPEARLIMVGDGPLWPSCKHLVEAEGLADGIELKGSVSNEEVALLMKRARAFVQHSVHALNGDCEGTPVAVIEAMSCALPVIATRHTGIADAVQDNDTGLLCEEHDAQRMAEQMIALIDDPGMARRMGMAGRERAALHYSMEQSISRLQLFLEQVAQR